MLTVYNFCVDAQQLQQFNRMQKNKQKGSKANKIQKERPLLKGKNFVTKEIPGLGSVRGRTIKSEWSGKTIQQFFDIPYAKAPSGILRFKEPVPASPWANILNARKPHHGCPSIQNLASYEKLKRQHFNVEDCLRLTINTKSVTKKAPVMVYIHGDFLYDGSSLEAAPGCQDVDKVKSLNKCLHKLNATELLEAFRLYGLSKEGKGAASGFIQFVVGGPSGILPQYPAKILTSANFKAYPTMGGCVKNGGTFILKKVYFDSFNETIIDDAMTGLDYINLIISHTNGADPTEAWKKYAEEEILSFLSLIDLCSTIAFKNPVLLAMQENAQKLPNSTYLYSFDYEGEINRYTTSDGDGEVNEMPFELGVSLADDNLYLFPWPRYLLLNSIRDIKIAKRMVAFWTSFAATGKPTAPHVPEWPSMNEETGPYMKIGKTVSIKDNYIDEFTAAVKETVQGFNLVNEEFFDSLVEVSEESDTDNQDADSVYVEGEEARGNIVLIAKKSKY